MDTEAGSTTSTSASSTSASSTSASSKYGAPSARPEAFDHEPTAGEVPAVRLLEVRRVYDFRLPRGHVGRRSSSGRSRYAVAPQES